MKLKDCMPINNVLELIPSP